MFDGGAVPSNRTLLAPPVSSPAGIVHLQYGLAAGVPTTGDMTYGMGGRLTDTDWTRGVLAGAVLGGIGWGLLAVDAVSVSNDDAYMGTGGGMNLPVAVGISLLCLVVAGVLPRTRVSRTVAVALVVAPVSGWFVVGLLYLQALAMGSTWR